jgi:hypothetical protein
VRFFSDEKKSLDERLGKLKNGVRSETRGINEFWGTLPPPNGSLCKNGLDDQP